MSIYLEHFGLREAPFRITPHTGFFFGGAKRGATLEALLYAITNDEGIVKVTGEVGSGKTMLCRMLLDKLPTTVETIYLANPSLGPDELLFALADELKIELTGDRVSLLLRALQQRLVDLYASGKQIVVLIDEAHAMPAESLEEIRLLSNLETDCHKLLQLVLFGQPELDDLLAQTNLRQLRERITHNFDLEPLRRDDVSSYLMFRLRAAGYHGPDLFNAAAIKLFAQASGGLTRRLNILGDKALLAAFAAEQHQIDKKIARSAIRDASFERLKAAVGTPPSTLWPALTAGIVVGFGLLLGWQALSHIGPPAVVQAAEEKALGPVAAGLASPATAASTGSPTRRSESPARREGVGRIAGHASLVEQHSAAFRDWISLASEQHYSIQLARVSADRLDEVEAFLGKARQLVPPDQLRVYSAMLDGKQWLGVVYGDFAGYGSAQRQLGELPGALTDHQAFIRPIRQLKAAQAAS
jgi:MSHA biogenesis protein MshM